MRNFVLLAAGIPPFHYHNHVQRMAVKEYGLAVHLDVSGSVNDYLPGIVGVLSSLTDGYASLNEKKQAELTKCKLQALTILFGGKTDCDDFAPFGGIVQLEDITE